MLFCEYHQASCGARHWAHGHPAPGLTTPPPVHHLEACVPCKRKGRRGKPPSPGSAASPGQSGAGSCLGTVDTGWHSGLRRVQTSPTSGQKLPEATATNVPRLPCVPWWQSPQGRPTAAPGAGLPAWALRQHRSSSEPGFHSKVSSAPRPDSTVCTNNVTRTGWGLGDVSWTLGAGG